MKTRALTALGIVAALAACGDATGPTAGQPGVSLSFTTRTPGSPPLAHTFAMGANLTLADTIVSSGDTLIITRAAIVLREIELERVETTECDDAVGNDDCEEFEVGPILVELPLNGQVGREVSVQIPSGTYDELEFEIHKISNSDQEDSTFRAMHPEFAGQSIRVEGTFNGQTFVFMSDLDVEQEFDLNPPLVVDSATTSTNVTVLVGLDGWFRSPTGGVLNPDTGNKGGVNESVIKENIKTSIEAFEDEDEDGDDEDEDDS